MKEDRYSLFLDISIGGRRWKEYLGLKLEKPRNETIRQANKEKMRFAEKLRMQRERQLWGMESDTFTKRPRAHLTDFFEVFSDFIASYLKKDKKVVEAALLQLKHFVGRQTLPIMLIDREFCEGFYTFMLLHLRGNTPMGYFKKFKMCLDHCVAQGMLTHNPARGIRLVCSDELVKDILSTEEIQRLSDTPLPHFDVKRAFLFACHTGLRWCDISTLKYKSVNFNQQILTIRQQKVAGHSSKAVLHLHMNTTAMGLLEKVPQRGPDDLVFTLPSYSYTLRLLKRWTGDAGISKHITFHCARHSFVTNLMLQGVHIKTASLLAGHSTIRHTEKYVHVIDELKKQAINSLPETKLNF